MTTAIIIDDEPHCIDRLSGLLGANHFHSIYLIGSYQTVEAGVDAIQKHNPDLVFLDVQIHQKTGFDLLHQLPKINFGIIFTTAYEKYAVQAFKFSAIDYLLKPIDVDDLKIAIAKFEEQKSKEEVAEKIDVLLNNLRNRHTESRRMSRRICVPVMSGIVVLRVSDIIRCQSDVNYTTFYLKDKQKLVVAKTLKEFEELLADYDFFRVHHSHLINLAYIKSYNKGKGGFVILEDNTAVEVSTRKKDEFLKRLAEM